MALKRYYYSLKFTDEITPYVNTEVVQQVWRSLALFPGLREGREVFVHALNCGRIPLAPRMFDLSVHQRHQNRAHSVTLGFDMLTSRVVLFGCDHMTTAFSLVLPRF